MRSAMTQRPTAEAGALKLPHSPDLYRRESTPRASAGSSRLSREGVPARHPLAARRRPERLSATTCTGDEPGAPQQTADEQLRAHRGALHARQVSSVGSPSTAA